MDSLSSEVSLGNTTFGLSYDDNSTYEEQVAALPDPLVNGGLDLAIRISSNRIYLPPDSMAKGKVRVVSG